MGDIGMQAFKTSADSRGTAPGLDLSVVIPVYRCADLITELYDRLRSVLDGLGLRYEILLVDDGSEDGSWEAITALASRARSVRGVKLSRNFGQHQAITAGLHFARGAWAIVMDCDLQDPPEDIPRLIDKAKEGYEVVLARRKNKQFSLFRRVAAKLYFALLNFLTSSHLDGEYGTFSLISRKVIDAFLDIGDIERHYLFVLQWLGFKFGCIEYQHASRAVGQSTYGLRSLLRHALSGVFFQTTMLLRGIVYFGFGVSFVGVVLAGYLISQYFLYEPPAGWTSLAVLLLVLSGATITSMGVTGLYVGRIFEQVKTRPMFVVDQLTDDAMARIDEEPVVDTSETTHAESLGGARGISARGA